MHGNLLDLSGQKFGKLEVLTEYKSKKYKNGTQTYWLCLCECGSYKHIAASKLKSGHTKSCGCYRKEFRKLEPSRAVQNKIFDDYKRGASKRGHDFQLSFDEFIALTQMVCHYCGDKPTLIRKARRKNGDFKYNGVDRVDNTKEYFTLNCVPCCKFCNRSKDILSEKEFLNKITKITKHRGLNV